MKKIFKNNVVRVLLLALKMIYIPFLLNGQATCSGTMNYSSISTTAPYTRIGNGSAGSVRICLTANSLTGKCAGTNSSIVIYSCSDATCTGTAGIIAIWDETTPVGTCLTVYTGSYPCNGYIRARRYCGGGSASISWTTVSNTTNVCNSTPIPQLTNGTDCINPTELCTSGTFPGNASGAGYQQLGCGSNATVRGCLLNGENNSAWYTFKALTSGTITLTIAPSANRDDYDFAIWSGTNCPPTTAPVRCSYELGTGTTGMNATATDNTEGAGGDGWVNDLTVVAGETYTLLVDGFATATDPNYDLTFGGTAQLDCGILPVEFIDVKGIFIKNKVKLEFTTIREKDNKYFEVEKSLDGKEFFVIKRLESVGNSDFKINYEVYDEAPVLKQYYRIKQTDNSGKYGFSEVISVSTDKIEEPKLIELYDTQGKTIYNLENYNGLYLELYDDGKIIKKIK